MTENRIWTKDFILICIINLTIFTSYYFLLPSLPLYITDVLHGNESNVGYIIGVFAITSVLFRPFAGYLLDTTSKKLIMVISLAALVIIAFAYNFVTSVLFLLILRAIHGTSWGFCSTGTGTIAGSLVPLSRRGEGIGYFGLTTTLGMALGPILSLYIIELYGYLTLFTIGSVVAAVGFLSATALGLKKSEVDKVEQKADLTLATFLEPNVFDLSLVMLFVTMTYSGVLTFITLYAKERAISHVGSYFLIYAITLLFVRPNAGKVFDRKGPKQVMAIGFLAMSVAFVLLFAANSFLYLIFSAICLGIGFGIINPSLQAMAFNRVKPFRRGAAMSTLYSSNDLGVAIGSILLGSISNLIGMQMMYLICSFILGFPALVFYLKVMKSPSIPTRLTRELRENVKS